MYNNSYRPQSYSLLPPVVKWLLILNALIYFISVILEDNYGIGVTGLFGLHYYLSPQFFPHQFFTYAFLHGSFMHLFSNMFALWMFGTMIENAWGGKRFLIFYMVTAIGAALTQYAFTYYQFHVIENALALYIQHPNPVDLNFLVEKHFKFVTIIPDIANNYKDFDSYFRSDPQNAITQQQSIDFINNLIQFKASIPTVGASGAVFGILLAFGMMFPEMLIYLYFFFPIKAKYFVMGYGAFEFFTAMQNDPNDNVAHLAHLGGMLFGFILIRIWTKKRHFD